MTIKVLLLFRLYSAIITHRRNYFIYTLMEDIVLLKGNF